MILFRRPLEEGDIVKIDISVFDGKFHGDNCSTSYIEMIKERER